MTDDVVLNDRRVSYTATADQTVFDIDYPIEVAGDVVVYKNGVLVSDDDYVVDVAGLTVTLDTGAEEGDVITIDGDTDPRRPSAFPRKGDLRSAILNGDFRRVFYILQELVRNASNNIALNPAQGSGISQFLPLLSQGRLIIWGANGLENGPDAGDIAAAQANAAAATAAAAAAESDATAAAASAASVNLPSIASQALKFLRVNSGETGYEHLTAAELATAISSFLSLSAFETGDTMWAFAASKSGWLKLDGSTLGSAASGADNAHADYADLYAYLWDNISDTYAPVSSGRGANAAADFAADKTITMPPTPGRALVGAGQGDGLTKNWAIGETDGDEVKTIAEENLPAHEHGVGSLATSSAGSHSHTVPHRDISGSGSINAGDGQISGADTVNTSSSGAHSHSITGSTGSTGSGTALDVQNPALAVNWFIKV